jgi:GET complex subunit GET2
MRALGVGSDRGSSEPPLLSAGGPPQPKQRAVSEGPNMDLLDALMAAQQQRPGTPGSTTAFSDASAFPAATKPQSKLQKLLPLIHVVSVWCLFAFFTVWREPSVHSENSPWQGKENSFWARWARLSPQSSRTPGETWQVQPVVRLHHVLTSIRMLTSPQPFWGALATLELILFSFRIFSGFVRRFSRKIPTICLTLNRRTRYLRPHYCRWPCQHFLHRCVPLC